MLDDAESVTLYGWNQAGQADCFGNTASFNVEKTETDNQELKNINILSKYLIAAEMWRGMGRYGSERARNPKKNIWFTQNCPVSMKTGVTKKISEGLIILKRNHFSTCCAWGLQQLELY